MNLYAPKLAEDLGADREVKRVSIAAWPHDIGSVMFGRKDHHKNGAKIAEEKLNELDYSNEKIELVKKCILTHKGSVNNRRESLEEKIVAEALSNFNN